MRDSKGRFVKGHIKPPEMRAKMGHPGFKHSEEFKKKMSGLAKGRVWSNESRKRASESRSALKKHWFCIDCGKEVARKVTKRCMGCVGVYRGGKNHYNWKGGISSKDRLERQRFRQTVQKEVLERDDYSCQMCGDRGCALQVDHIQPWSEYVELRFDINNCRTLCMDCHYKITFGKEIPKDVKAWGHNLSKIGIN